jgi:hypothetical protein
MIDVHSDGNKDLQNISLTVERREAMMVVLQNHMKAKQLEIIKARHEKFLAHGFEKRPDSEAEDIQYAILNGNPPKLKKPGDILSALKRRIIADRYDRGPRYTDIFIVPKTGRIAEWEVKENARLKRVAAYRKVADPLILNAELHDDSDADEVAQQLIAAAKENGLFA